MEKKYTLHNCNMFKNKIMLKCVENVKKCKNVVYEKT